MIGVPMSPVSVTLEAGRAGKRGDSNGQAATAMRRLPEPALPSGEPGAHPTGARSVVRSESDYRT